MLLKRLITFFCILSLASAAVAQNYVVRRGDTLSHIAQKHIPGTIYGKSGSLERLLSLNSNIANPDLIYPRQLIILDTGPSAIPYAKASVPKRDLASVSVKETQPAGFLSVESALIYQKFSGIDLDTQGESDLYSTESYALKLEWSTFWSESFETLIGLEYGKYAYEAPTNRTLEVEEYGQTRVSLALRKHFTSNFNFYTELGYGTRLFLNAPSETEVKLDKANVGSLELGFNYRLIQAGSSSLIVGLAAIGVSASKLPNYKSEESFGGAASLEFGHQRKLGDQVYAKVKVTKVDQNTQLIEQSLDEARVSIGYRWRMD